MAAPSWIILSTSLRVSDTPLPNDAALSLKVEAPPRVSVLTVAPWVSPIHKGGIAPFIDSFDPSSGLLLVFTGSTTDCDLDGSTGPEYCVVLDVRDSSLSYRLPEKPFPSYFDDYTKPGVIADPDGDAGDFLLGDFHFRVGSDDGNDDTLVRYWSRTGRWRAELEVSPDQAEDEIPDRAWVFDHVVPHAGKFWWIDPRAGLLTCDAFGEEPPPFLFVPLPDFDGGEYRLSGRRYVQLSDGEFRCVQIGKPTPKRKRDHSHDDDAAAAAAPTFVTMCTLLDPEEAVWTEPEYKLSFADIRASDTFKASGLPEDKDPVFALIHPQNPDVLYFYLDDYLFAFDMRAGELIEWAAHGLGINPSSSDVVAWELPPDYAAAIAAAPAPAPAPAASSPEGSINKKMS